MQNDLTRGSVLARLTRFALPFLLSYFLQTLYGLADLFIVGQYEDVAATTAVSIGSQVMHMLTVMIVGLAMGSTVLIAQAVGKQDHSAVRARIVNTAILFAGLSLALTLLLILLVRPIVALMSTPEEAVEQAVAYLRICFAGIPFITAYNIISSIFRGLGDSKSPLAFIAVACVCNIGLDYWLIGGMRLGAAGAAFSTTISQAISVLFAVCIIRARRIVQLQKKDFHPNRSIMGGIFGIGAPVALQDGFIQVSFILITVIANRRGLTDAAAVGIVEKIIGFLFLLPSTLLCTVSALSAQNIGAGKFQRAKQTMWYAIAIGVLYGTLAVLLMQFAALQAVGLFTTDAATAAAGSAYLHGYTFDVLLAGVHFCFSGYFCALGKSGLSFLHNAISIVFVRVPGAYVMSHLFPQTLLPMGLSSSAGSLCSIVICILCYILLSRSKRANL